MKISEKAYINKVVWICYYVVTFLLSIAYIVEFVKGSRTILYTIGFCAIALIPPIICIIAYKMNKETNLIKYMLAVGYLVLYAYALFTASSELVYTYIFPMMIVITLYSSVKYSAWISGFTIAINVADVIYASMGGGYGISSMQTLEIRAVSIIMVIIFSILATICLNKINANKLSMVEKDKNTLDQTLNATLRLAETVSVDIADVRERMVQLGDSVSYIQNSMKEVSDGSTETAEAVQKQLLRTEEIQNSIIDVKNQAVEMSQEMRTAMDIVNVGKNHVDTLSAQVEKSNEANGLVITKMESLVEYAANMNTIIEAITGIANKTGLLALNASIEAARAGEAGRGFAVVASEISTLANQTKTATVDITTMISAMGDELKAVASAIEQVDACNKSNVASAEKVASSFAQIAEYTESVEKHTGNMGDAIFALESANNNIVDSIQTISAITEEVSAHAGETYNACENNRSMVDEVAEIVENVNNATKSYMIEE